MSDVYYGVDPEIDYVLISRIVFSYDVKWEVGFFRKGKETIYQSYINDRIKPKAIEDSFIAQGYELAKESTPAVHILKRPTND